MEPQHPANMLWSFATLGRMLGAEARVALEAAVVRLAWVRNEQHVSNISWSFATLGLIPGAEAQAALEAAVVRVAPGMNGHALSDTLWSFLNLAATRGVPLPACYPSLWRAACGLDVGSLKNVGL